MLFEHSIIPKNKTLIVNRQKTFLRLDEMLLLNNLNDVKRCVALLQKDFQNFQEDSSGLFNITEESHPIRVSQKFLIEQLDQILETETLERTHYYIKRLRKSLSETKTGKVNDLNLNRWQEHDDILTDSLWMLQRRDTSGAHYGGYWGNFVPEIPRQFFKRYTKKGDWVLDTFLGSGTSLIECRRQGRNGIGIELQERVAEFAQSTIEREPNPCKVETRVMVGDSATIDYQSELHKMGIDQVQFLMMHPPYWDIIKFSPDKRDLSNAQSVNEFLAMLGNIVAHTYSVLEKGRYFALVIGDKYSGGEWIPLGFLSMQEVLKKGYKLKSIIVKNFEETKGKRNQHALWRYRALVGGFYIFKHEYIFLFKK